MFAVHWAEFSLIELQLNRRVDWLTVTSKSGAVMVYSQHRFQLGKFNEDDSDLLFRLSKDGDRPFLLWILELVKG